MEGRIPDIFLFFSFFFDTIPDIFQYDGFDRFIGNKDLCGDIKGFAPCPPSSKTTRQVKIWVPFSLLSVLLLLRYIFHSRHQVRKTQSQLRGTKSRDLFSIWDYDDKIAYEDSIEATKDFDIRY